MTTTTRPHRLDEWLRYHIVTGVDHIWVVVDDATDTAAIGAARSFPEHRVTVLVSGADLLEPFLALFLTRADGERRGLDRVGGWHRRFGKVSARQVS